MTEPKTKRFQILITPEQNARLFRLSKLEMIPASAIARDGLLKEIKRREGKKKILSGIERPA